MHVHTDSGIGSILVESYLFCKSDIGSEGIPYTELEVEVLTSKSKLVPF